MFPSLHQLPATIGCKTCDGGDACDCGLTCACVAPKRTKRPKISWTVPDDRAGLKEAGWNPDDDDLEAARIERFLINLVKSYRLDDGFHTSVDGRSVLIRWHETGKPTTDWSVEQWADALNHWILLFTTYVDAIPQREAQSTR